jgi:riboflavin transporter FmnP
MSRRNVVKLTVVANLTALSILLYFLKFPLPFMFPSFLEIQFSNLPAIIGGFALGPIGGASIVVIRYLIKLLSSTSAGVGELIDLLIGLSTVLVSSFIYRKHKTKKGAFYASIAGIITWTFVAVMANYLFIIDFYIEFYFGGDVSPLIGMMSVIPNITAENYMEKYILFAAIPFNILLSSLVFGVTFLVYKRISNLIHYFADKK